MQVTRDPDTDTPWLELNMVNIVCYTFLWELYTSPHSPLFLQINEYFVLLPVDICDVLDGGILDKVAPDDALEGDGGAGVVELLRRDAVV